VTEICDPQQQNGVDPPNTHEHVDQMIDACQSIHDGVADIRHSLLMNRNPEDVDSDNEYEEG
jgi:hypothetical protein